VTCAAVTALMQQAFPHNHAYATLVALACAGGWGCSRRAAVCAAIYALLAIADSAAGTRLITGAKMAIARHWRPAATGPHPPTRA